MCTISTEFGPKLPQYRQCHLQLYIILPRLQFHHFPGSPEMLTKADTVSPGSRSHLCYYAGIVYPFHITRWSKAHCVIFETSERSCNTSDWSAKTLHTVYVYIEILFGRYIFHKMVSTCKVKSREIFMQHAVLVFGKTTYIIAMTICTYMYNTSWFYFVYLNFVLQHKMAKEWADWVRACNSNRSL